MCIFMDIDFVFSFEWTSCLEMFDKTYIFIHLRNPIFIYEMSFTINNNTIYFYLLTYVIVQFM